MTVYKPFWKIIFIVGLTSLLTIIVFFVWSNLPVTINRRSDIKFGNQLINNINNYKKQHGLPQTDDWTTLKKLGFKFRGDLVIPDYQKLNDTAFELVYLEGFDGPYLLWNSFDKKWEKSFLTHFKDNHIEEDVVSLIEQSTIYRDRSKLIDSLSSGQRGLSLIVFLQDTVKNIYLVKGSEDNGTSLVTHFNYLVDANKMTILNPTGKLEGQ
ncbi:MAG: hypothetical protein V4556_05925 [Bacteroidota bacterium]